MAKIKLNLKRPPQRKARARVSVHHLMQVCGSIATHEVVKELQRLDPAREVLLKLLSTLQTVQASSEIIAEVTRYCGERGCDPNRPPVAKHCHKTPTADLEMTYNVQYTKRGRPYLRLPLDPLGEPDHVLVKFGDETISLRATTA